LREWRLHFETFGGFDKFKEEFKNAGMTQFRSGWARLIRERAALKVIKTLNADTPIAHGQKLLLAIDVREHA
jgi:Fe-Mn family superoxide dismutase